jgi:hypothetical protein
VKRLSMIVLFAGSLFLWAAAAEAKELSAFKACGAEGCKDVTDRAVLRSLIRSVENQGEPISTRTPRPSPFFRLEFSVRGDEAGGPSFVQYYAPEAGRIAIETNPEAWTWVRAGSLRALFDRVTVGIKPFPRPVVSRVLIGGQSARDPASYTRLFSLDTATNDYPDNGDWVTISLQTAKPTPWSTGTATLEFSPSKNVLWRGSEFLKIPGGMATQLEKRQSLNETASGTGFPWALAGGLGGAAIFVPAAFLFRRRRSR